MEFLTFWKNPGMFRISPAATEMLATTSSTESARSRTPMSSFFSSIRSPGKI
ncbi:hypothetical protein AVEN_200751-1, partial [Araneus ventricosus]